MESELLRLSQEDFERAYGIIYFDGDEDTGKFLNDLENYPHAFVLGALMDKQITSEKAWVIPYKVYKELDNFDINFLSNVPLKKYKELFNNGKYHRFNNDCAIQFYEAILKIKNDYGGDASKIWANNPSSAAVVYKFLEFKGAGLKIATMATDMLIRQFKVPMSDYYSIDISVDVHIRRLMSRLGYVPDNASKEQIIYKAREINPEYPGLIDRTLWKIGRNHCHPNNPECDSCPLKNECEYNLNLK